MRPVESAEASTSPQSRAGMPAAAGKEPREPQGAAPSPSWQRCNAVGRDGWSSWEDQLSRRNQDIFDYKEFRELSPEVRLGLVRKHGLCKLCLGRCDPGGKRLHKECRWRNQIWHELCQERSKCRRGHHRLLHMEDMRSLQAARPAKPAKPPDRLGKSSACGRTEASRGAPAEAPPMSTVKTVAGTPHSGEAGGRRGHHQRPQEQDAGSAMARGADTTAPQNAPGEQRAPGEQQAAAGRCEREQIGRGANTAHEEQPVSSYQLRRACPEVLQLCVSIQGIREQLSWALSDDSADAIKSHRQALLSEVERVEGAAVREARTRG